MVISARSARSRVPPCATTELIALEERPLHVTVMTPVVPPLQETDTPGFEGLYSSKEELSSWTFVAVTEKAMDIKTISL